MTVGRYPTRPCMGLGCRIVVMRQIVLDTIESKADLAELCRRTLESAPGAVPPDLPIDSKAGAPEWYDFEHRAWEAGEHVRQAFSRNRTWKKDAALREQVLEVAVHRQLRRGRQAWVMALGFVDAHELAPGLAVFLSDPDVEGQIVDTLIRMRAGDFSDRVWPLTNHEQAWVRKLARRYLKQYATAP